MALALEANPNLTWRDVQHCVVTSAVAFTTTLNSSWNLNRAGLTHSHNFGFGLIDAEKLVKTAIAWKEDNRTSRPVPAALTGTALNWQFHLQFRLKLALISQKTVETV